MIYLSINKFIFIYCENMGKPQGISSLIEYLKAEKDRENYCYVVVGDVRIIINWKPR